MKKIIFFVFLLSLVSRGSEAQNYGTKDPGAAGILKRTTLSQTVIAVPGTDYVIPSGVTKTAVGLPNVDNTSDVNKPVSTAQATAIAGKQATLVSGTNIKTINGNSLLGSGDLTIAGGSGGSAAYKAYADVSYASTINLNFDATTNTNIPAVSGNITFTGTNNTSGKYYTVQLTKSNSSDVIIYLNATSFPLAKPISYTLLAKPSLVSTPRSFTLSGPSGTQFLMNIDMLPAGPYVTITNIADSDYPVVQKANILNLKNFAAIADPGNTTAETTVNTFKVVAGTLSDSSNLIINYIYRRASGSGQLQVKIRACPANNSTLSTCPTIDDFGQSSTFGDFRRTAILTNLNLSSNLVQPGYSEQVANFPAASTRNIDFSQDVYLKFTVEKQTSGTQVGGFLGVRINGEGL